MPPVTRHGSSSAGNGHDEAAATPGVEHDNTMVGGAEQDPSPAQGGESLLSRAAGLFSASRGRSEVGRNTRSTLRGDEQDDESEDDDEEQSTAGSASAVEVERLRHENKNLNDRLADLENLVSRLARGGSKGGKGVPRPMGRGRAISHRPSSAVMLRVSRVTHSLTPAGRALSLDH